MKKNLIRILCALICLMMLPLSAASAAEPKKATIGIALYQDGGPAPTATKAYLAMVGEKLNLEFKYVVLSSQDENFNVTKIQELISSGVDGIITTMDSATATVIDECEAAGVYLGGYLCDFNDSFTKEYDVVFTNPFFVGAVADGRCTDDVTTGKDYFDSLIAYNEQNPEAPITHVSMTTFPAFAFPQHQEYVKQFVACIDEYNTTAATPITVDPLDDETDVLMFSPMDSTYFSKHPGIQAVMSFCAGKFSYPTMISAGVAGTIKLFAAGYEEGDCDNFGTKGTGTYQQAIVSPAEAINYPLVLMVNAINGLKFADQPENAERKSCDRLIMRSDEDMDAFKGSLYLTGNADDALFTAEDVYNMTAFNPDATYEGLCNSLWQMSIDAVKAK